MHSQKPRDSGVFCYFPQRLSEPQPEGFEKFAHAAAYVVAVDLFELVFSHAYLHFSRTLPVRGAFYIDEYRVAILMAGFTLIMLSSPQALRHYFLQPLIN